MQNILINLNIISKIKPGNKIFINNDNLINIEYDNVLQGLIRFFYNNSRNKTINNLDNFYLLAFNQIDNLINSKYLNIKNDKSNFLVECKYNLQNDDFLKIYTNLMEMNHYICLSIGGLNNLKKTYISDILTSSKIDIIINSIENFIKKINKKLEHIDNIKRTILNENEILV